MSKTKTKAERDLELAEAMAEEAEKRLHEAEATVAHYASTWQRAERALIEARFKVRAEKLKA